MVNGFRFTVKSYFRDINPVQHETNRPKDAVETFNRWGHKMFRKETLELWDGDKLIRRVKGKAVAA